MKYKMLIGIVICLLIVIIVVLFINKNIGYKDISDIKTFKYFYSGSTASNSETRYEIVCSDKCIGLVKIPYKDEVGGIEISNSDMDKLISLINKYRVSSWNGFNKNDKRVKDGRSFSLDMETDNGEVSARGYMKYPKQFREFRDELDELMKKYANDTETRGNLFDDPYYEGFDINNVVSMKIQRNTVAGIDVKEVTDKSEILSIYNVWKNATLTSKSMSGCEDNTTIYRFIMKDNKEYKIEIECEWIVIGNNRYNYTK